MAKREEILRRLATALAERREILFAYAHGSFAEGRPFRDLDVAVWVDPDVERGQDPLDHEIDLGLALERVVGLRVDVRRLNEAPLGFRFYASRGTPLISHDDDLRNTLVEQFRDAYWDFQPVAQRHLVEVLGG